MTFLRRGLVDRAIPPFLAAATTKAFFLGEAPANPADQSYGVVYPLDLTPVAAGGSLADEHDWLELYYQITNYGETRRLATWLSDRVFSALTERGSVQQGYRYAIDLPGGLFVNWRELQSRGRVEPTGERLYQAVDTYCLRVGYAA